MIEKILRFLEFYIIPRPIFKFFQPAYHFILSILGALIYRLPARKLKVIGVTGTKGKTTSVELINAILEEAGYKTAIISTLRFKIGKKEERNLYKMTTPGRFFIQRTIRRAVNEKCEYIIIELTSQGVLQSRHLFTFLNTLLFTNLSPEHIEAHGSFEKYKGAKLKIVRELERSWKRPRVIVANGDDPHAVDFLSGKVEKKRVFSLADAKPYELLNDGGINFTYRGDKTHSRLSGEFNLSNILSAIAVAETEGIEWPVAKRAIEKFSGVRGRLEKIEEGQNFSVIVDYAHTPDSLEKVYQIFQNRKKICVLGGTGGGRDKWKRPEMGRVAGAYCEHIILTDEDPYDENPRSIAEDIAKGIERPIYEIEMDRRAAIRKALSLAKKGDVVIITGKGTDPYIMGPRGQKTPWDDASVAREELKNLACGKATNRS